MAATDRAELRAFDNYASSHLSTKPEHLHRSLDKATSACRSAGLPQWDVNASQGKFFMLQCRMMRAGSVLEIGTLAGHGAIWYAAANPHIRVTTIEVNEEFAAVARINIANAGLCNRVELIVSDARAVIPKLAADIQNGERTRPDVVIVDLQDTTRIWDFVDLSIGLCIPGACIMAHCALRLAKLYATTQGEEDTRGRGSRDLVERKGSDNRLDAGLLMSVGENNYDVMLAVVIDGIQDG
ncbi:hypothetical protein LTR36_007395 [Oleoguttula mirabilis]|uniref:O-methyltransferase n=1 Tax=Oleoguttula mirabilis TaxID=1507867 RepID=A0AAV9J9W3_9PEZI|nr:hypothetical protein LTR36_007395 [Oleoguttula mirabilis]